MARINELPVMLTSFAYREPYFSELDGLLATVKKHHPDWPIVTGKGPVPGVELPTMEVESPSGNCLWSLPVALNLDDSVDDWRKITKMKAWWLARVFREFGSIVGNFRRVLWIDADARVNGPLDIELDAESELIAGAWWSDARHPGYESIASGFLVFQGTSGGMIESILSEWSDTCLAHIQNLPNPPIVPWGDGDQEVLNQILKKTPSAGRDYAVIRLSSDKYCAIVDKEGKPLPGALVDQWVMARKMKWPKDRDRSWPPSEAARRPIA
jgi:hypothetical protein